MEHKQIIQFEKDLNKFKKSLYVKIKKMMKYRSTYNMQLNKIHGKTISDVFKDEKPLEKYRVETLISLYSKLEKTPTGIKVKQRTNSKYR